MGKVDSNSTLKTFITPKQDFIKKDTPNIIPKENPLVFIDAETKKAEFDNLGAIRNLVLKQKLPQDTTTDPNQTINAIAPENEQLLEDILAKHTNDPTATSTLENLVATEGFDQLTAEEQAQLLNYVGGTNNEISQPARAALQTMLNDPNADKTNPETFRQFLRDQPGLTHTVGSTAVPGQYDANRLPYTVTGPTDVANHNFPSGNADALRYEVTIDGQTVPVYLPKNPVSGSNYHSIEEIAKGLAALPPASLDVVNSVSADPNQNPQDAYWAQEYNNPNFRSYMTAGAAGDITIYPTTSKQSQTYLDASLIHETGHTLSKQLMGESDIPGRQVIDAVKDLFGAITWNDWQAAMDSDGVSPSVYAQSSLDEDFAETLTLYMTVRGTPEEAELRAIMPARFALMDQILGN